MIAKSLFDIVFAAVDILSLYVYRRGLVTCTYTNTPVLHNTLALCIMKSGLIRTDTKLQQRLLEK